MRTDRRKNVTAVASGGLGLGELKNLAFACPRLVLCWCLETLQDEIWNPGLQRRGETFICWPFRIESFKHSLQIL